MNIITTPLIPYNAWLNIYDLGIEQKFSYNIENISNVPIRIVFSATVPSLNKKNTIIIQPNEIYFIPSLQEGVYLSVDTDNKQEGRVALYKCLTNALNSSSRKISRLVEPRILTQSLTQIESASIDGRVYYSLIDYTVTANQTVWLNFNIPSDKELALVSTIFTPFYTGFESRIYVGSQGMNNGSVIPIKRNNLAYGEQSQVTAYFLSSAPSTIGTLYDIPYLIPVSGSNPNQRTAGITSRDSGYQIFPKGSNFQVSLINSSGLSNRVVGKLVWLEAGSTIIDGF